MKLPIFKNNTIEEFLQDFDRESFVYDWENNDHRQISFTIYRTNLNAELFDLLQIGVSIIFDDQEYVVQQANPSQDGQRLIKDVTATHVRFECLTDIYQYNTKGTDEKPVTVGPADILAWFFDGNDSGYSYEVLGTFATKQLSGLTGSGKDCIDTITNNWDCYVFSDNKHIVVYDADHFKKVTSKQFRYLYNTSDIKATIDRTAITNACMCYPKQNDNGSYVFDPFLYRNEASIAKWGVRKGAPVSDERFTSKDSMTTYAATQVHPDPDVSLALTNLDNDDVVEGEVRLFIAPLMGFDADVTVLGLKKYPYAAKQPEVTLSNSLKDIYKIQREIASAAKKAQASAGSALKLSGDAKTAVDALDQVAVRIGSGTQSQSAKLSTMAVEADTTPVLPVLKPDGSIFYPETDASAIKNLPVSPVTSVAGKTGAVSLDKSDVGLDQVDNTSDADKPVSSLQRAELDKKLDKIFVSPNGNKFTLSVSDDGQPVFTPYVEGGDS